MLHCLASNCDQFPERTRAWLESFDEPATCMLPDGHAGPHVWTPINEVIVTLAAEGLVAEGELRR